MSRAGIIIVALTLLIPFAGCMNGVSKSAYLMDYEIAEPPGCVDNAYEDADMRLVMDIVEGRRYALSIDNKTESPMFVFWKNSLALNAHGEKVALGAVFGEGDDQDGLVSMVEAGDSIYAEVFPVENSFRFEDGDTGYYPLYFVGSRKGSASDLKDARIGLLLVMGVNRHTTTKTFLLKIRPSSSGI